MKFKMLTISLWMVAGFSGINTAFADINNMHFYVKNASATHAVIAVKNATFLYGAFHAYHHLATLPMGQETYTVTHGDNRIDGDFKIAYAGNPADYCLISVEANEKKISIHGYYNAELKSDGKSLHCSLAKTSLSDYTVNVTDSSTPVVGKLVKVTARAIITASTEVTNGLPTYHKDYRMTLQSGTLPGSGFFDYDKAFDDDLFDYDTGYGMGHYFLAFQPYNIVNTSHTNENAEQVVPVSGLLTQKNKDRGGMVGFSNNTQFLYRQLKLNPGDDPSNDAIKNIRAVQEELQYEKTGAESFDKIGIAAYTANSGVDVIGDKNPMPAGFMVNGDITVHATEKSRTIFNNGLNQGKIGITLTSTAFGGDIPANDDTFYGELYHHIFFVQCKSSACEHFQPITGVYNSKGYLSVNTDPGPYVGQLGGGSYHKLKSELGQTYYVSGMQEGQGDHTVYIAPMLCMLEQDPSQPDVQKVDCSGVTDSVITLTLKSVMPVPDPNFTDKSTLGYPAGDAAFKIVDGKEPETTLSPLVFSMQLASTAALNYPLLIGIPQYYVPQAERPLGVQNGKFVNFDSDFTGAKDISLHVVDQYGNLVIQKKSKY